MISFDDPVQEPWYVLDFQMTRWPCPQGLPVALLQDVIEAIAPMDQMLVEFVKLVDRFSYGLESSDTRYIPEAAYELFRTKFEIMEDEFELARRGLETRWKSLMATHESQIKELPSDIQARFWDPEAAYTMKFSVTEVELEETLKQYLSGIHPDKELKVLMT